MLQVLRRTDRLCPVSGDYLTTGQAARLLGVSRWTVIRYTGTDKLQAVTLPSGDRRIPKGEVEQLLREGKRDGS